MRISEQIFPRPVCLITTCDKEGRPNIMTASFLMPISFNPKYIAFSIAPSRYSFKNLKEIKEFGLNVCSKEMKEAAWICGTRSGKSCDKFKEANLTPENSKVIKPPLVKESPISFECKVEFMKEFGDHFIVVGKVVREVIRKKKFKPLVHKSMDIFPEIQ